MFDKIKKIKIGHTDIQKLTKNHQTEALVGNNQAYSKIKFKNPEQIYACMNQ